MATVTELRNEAREALAKAQELAASDDKEAYQRAWDAFTGAKEKLDRAEQAASAAKDLADRPTIPDLRDPSDAEDVPNVPKAKANERPDGFIELQSGVIVPYATKHTEGYIKNSPAAVQLPSIMARYGPDLRAEAELQRKAFAVYIRSGARARAFAEDPKLANALRALNTAMQEDTDSEGGYLVPTDQRMELLHDPGVPGGVTRRISRVLQTSRDGGTIPSGASVTWGAIAEEATPIDVAPVISQVSFTIRKSGMNFTLSEELLADSAVDLPAYIDRLVTENSGRYEDQQAIEGDGSTEPLGLRTTGSAQGNVSDITDLLTLAAPTLAEIVNAYFELPAQYRDGAVWHTTSSFMARVAAISATGGQQWILPQGSGRPMLNILGAPVVMFDGTGWDDAATIAANEELGAFGNFQNYIFVDRLGTVVRRDDSVAFRSDQVAFKARKRYDSFFAIPNAFRILKAATF